MINEGEIKELLNTGKWAYTIIDKEIYFKYLGNKDKTDLGYILYFDWPESEEQTNEKRRRNKRKNRKNKTTARK